MDEEERFCAPLAAIAASTPNQPLSQLSFFRLCLFAHYNIVLNSGANEYKLSIKRNSTGDCIVEGNGQEIAYSILNFSEGAMELQSQKQLILANYVMSDNRVSIWTRVPTASIMWHNILGR